MGFVRGSKVYVEANIKLTTGGTGLQSVFVKADNPDGYNLAWTEAPVVDGYVKLPKTQLKKLLPNKVDYAKNFDFKWTIELIHEPMTTEVGTSTNELFVTLAAPKPPVLSYIAGGRPQYSTPKVYVTPLWLFCSGAAGSANVADSVAGAFKPFESRDVKSYDDPDKVRNDPSLKMYYYKDWTTTHANLIRLFEKVEEKDATGKTTAVYYDGQCNAWTDLLRQCVLEGGLPNVIQRVAVSPRNPDPNRLSQGSLDLWIKEWKPDVAGRAVYINEGVVTKTVDGKIVLGDYISLVGDEWRYVWVGTPQFEDKPGVGGQNTPDPASLFTQHFVIRYGNTIFDPSYGKKYLGAGKGEADWFLTCRKWEVSSLDGVSESTDKTAKGVTTRRWTITKTDYTNPTARFAVFTASPW